MSERDEQDSHDGSHDVDSGGVDSHGVDSGRADSRSAASDAGAAGTTMTSEREPRPSTRGARSGDRINPIVKFSVERRVTMGMAVLGLLVLGWMSLTRIPLEFLPSFSSSDVSVSVPYPSASPEEVERLIVRPLEDSLGTINGLDVLRSAASDGSANINLSFVEGTDMELITVEIRDRIDRVRDDLPSDVERVFIRRFQSTDIPILRSSLAAPWEEDRFFDFVENVLQPRLERLEGVAQVRAWGVRSRELQINLIPTRLRSARIDTRTLAQTLRENHINVSAGYLREQSQRWLVRTVGEFQTLAEIRNLPIRADGLRLGDVATVEYNYPKQTSSSFLNGKEAVGVAINKASYANLLNVVERVKAEYAAIQETPEGEGLEVRHFHDASLDVSQGLSELGRSGLLGGGLAIVFMFLFLRKFRSTLLVAIAVPLSLVMTFVIMYLARQAELTNMTLNVMSLMGLMLAVGMLLDNSIVVIESIFRHREELGEDSRTAALRGASEVAMPIICSTVTTMCVFLPLMFVSQQGRFTRFMGDIGTTVCIVMLGSLFVSLTVVPLVAAHLLHGESKSRQTFITKLVDLYGNVVRFTLHHRFWFAVAIILLLWGSWRLYSGIERTFSPPSENRQISLFVDMPKRYSVEQRAAVFDEVYQLLDAKRADWEIADISHEFRSSGGRTRGRHGGSVNRFELYLKPEEESTLRASDVQDQLRDALPVKAGVTFKIAKAERGPPGAGGSSLSLELIGDDLQILELLSPVVTQRLREVPFLKDIDNSLESGDDEIVVGPNRERALQAGLTSQAIAQTVSSSLSSRNMAYYKTDEREIGLVMQYRESDRESLDQLESMPVFASGAPLPMSSLADFEVRPGAKSIERENRRSKIEITATTANDMPSFVAMRAVQGTLSSIGLPEGYEWSFGRSWQDAEAEGTSALFAFLFAILLIYMIMASLFENFVQPFTILLSIPFAFIGVGVIMKLAGQPRSSAADMGLLILAGIVVNNAIVLIDHINGLRREGLSREEAVILGGKHRLRPIIMTAVTTILGLSPMVAPFFFPDIFGQPEGRAAFWAPVGLVILGGLAASTILTVLVIPTIYTLLDDFAGFFKRVARAA